MNLINQYHWRKTEKVVKDLKKLEHSLNYKFENKTFIEHALTHRSVSSTNNERLEYLGDSLLGFVIAETLYLKFPDATEGELTRLRASLVKGETLAKIAKKLDLSNYIKLGPGELKSGGWRRVSILSNALEAVIGAVYLDSGFKSCRKVVKTIFSELLDNLLLNDIEKDPKTRLQELLQAKKYSLPVYKVLSEEGAAHKKKFHVECKVEELDVTIQAEGRSKRAAEQSAANKVLKLIQT